MNPRIYFALSLLAVLTSSITKVSAAISHTKVAPIPSVISQSLPPTKKPIIVSELVEKLRIADMEERSKIIQQLSDSQENSPENIIPELIKALSDPDPLVKSAVAEVLGNFTDRAVAAIPALIEMMGSSQRAIIPSPYLVFPRISQAIAPIIPPPISASNTPRIPPTPPKNPENLLRITAIAALGKIGLPARTAATQPLTQALQDPDPWVKLNATWALAEIGASTPILNYWLEAIQHPNPELRRNAAIIIQDSRSLLRKSFGAEANTNIAIVLVSALKDDDYAVRDAAKSALEMLGTKALPGLIQGLSAPEPLVRLEAVKLLGNTEGTAQPAVSTLVKLLKDTGRYVPPKSDISNVFLLPDVQLPSFSRKYPLPPDNPEKMVRINAAIALGQIGDSQAIPALTTVLKDNNPWMQLASNWALIRLGQNQGLPVIGKLVQHPQAKVQRDALYQLKYYGSQSAPYLLPYYKAQLDSNDDEKRNNAIIGIGDMGATALNLVPKLRTILMGNRKNSSGYAATILGQVAQDTATAWHKGNLSPQQRQQAITEFAKVLQIMEAPKAKFNRQPRDRVRNALTTLRNSK
ncbi:HEAT repeat domain-containing protein [Calothrix sp. PCC 6303]|uniref:HEAT repeat domain-containing protein n=1 Tax=Calothrix sp. PCC 6303 TaxID=1170562 RepID=UPI0002A05218|nr:HEAT repeat domain-containing protein [Calothrix sp. PCC 6303]AFZ01460.1 HEAT domain containing protein [Calothrix sp. PCC 6303]